MLNLYSVIFDDNEIYAKDFEKPLSAQDFVLPFLGRIEKCRINFKVKSEKNLYLKVLQIYLTFPKLHVIATFRRSEIHLKYLQCFANSRELIS